MSGLQHIPHPTSHIPSPLFALYPRLGEDSQAQDAGCPLQTLPFSFTVTPSITAPYAPRREPVSLRPFDDEARSVPHSGHDQPSTLSFALVGSPFPTVSNAFIEHSIILVVDNSNTALLVSVPDRIYDSSRSLETALNHSNI